MSKLYTVGQKVQIKTWDQLLDTEGSYLDIDDDVMNKNSMIFFSKGMRFLCGEIVTVESLREDKVYEYSDYTIADWMVLPVQVDESFINSRIEELEQEIGKYKEMLEEIEAEKKAETEKLFEALLTLEQGDKLKIHSRGKEFNYIVTFDGVERIFIVNIENGKHLVYINSSVKVTVETIKRYAKLGTYEHIIYTKKTGEVYEAKF